MGGMRPYVVWCKDTQKLMQCPQRDLLGRCHNDMQSSVCFRYAASSSSTLAIIPLFHL